MIAFVGSVFSPTYARARTRVLRAEPDQHCALNVALYGPAARWTFTEHPIARVRRTPDAFELGASNVRWDGDALVLDLDERTPMLGRPLRGRVRVLPGSLSPWPEMLDPDGRHQWWCLAPLARVEVELSHPRMAWSGDAYLDFNAGREPLELGMRRWDWCRARGRDDAIVLYDTWPRRGEPVERAFRFDAHGGRTPVEGLVRHDLSPTRWRLQRSMRSDPHAPPGELRVLEDTPFYSRSIVRAQMLGSEREVVHESVSLDRFRRPVVQAMLPFRIRQRWRA